MQSRIDRLEDHFIICAYGRVGRAVAREFESDGVPFVVVDPNEAVADRLVNDGVIHLAGDPTNEATLLAAGVKIARGLITAVDSDATNVYITMAARALNPDLFIVARASERDSPDHLYRAGANRVISPYVSSGRHMALLSLRPRVIDYLDIAGLGEKAMRIEEVRIESGSPFSGATVAELCVDSIPLLLRKGRGDTQPTPTGSERLEVGDVLVLVREQESSRPARR
jgi:voltage-gated potassium channel